jgi:hypothetical protein
MRFLTAFAGIASILLVLRCGACACAGEMPRDVGYVPGDDSAYLLPRILLSVQRSRVALFKFALGGNPEDPPTESRGWADCASAPRGLIEGSSL